MDVKDTEAVHIDDVEGFDKILDPVVGSTRLINEFEVVLVPTPSNDPNGSYFQNPAYRFSSVLKIEIQIH